MAEEQKPVEVPITQEAPATAVEAAAETKSAEETPAAAPEATEEPAAPAAETATEAAPAAEEAKTAEAKPVEEGNLEVKGSAFPKNLLYSKKFFWFGADAVDHKATPTFKVDKAAHEVAAWAAETGKGLLFYSEKADKTAPHGAILLSEASEPAVDGTNKFHITSKNQKHTFKAGSATERDNWVAQLKAKIAEAKELATTVTASEAYTKTIEALKPAPVKKEEKVPVAEAAPAAAATEEAATAAEEAPKDVPATEPVAEEAKKEEPKRRSASRKRASIFGSFLGGKKEEEKKAAEAPAEPEAPVAEASAAEPEAAPEAPVQATEAAPVAAAEEKKEEVAEAKPAPIKRQSIFGNLSFGKKKAVVEPEVSKDAPVVPAAEPVAEAAPVIPAVETTEPLSAEVASPATVPTETTDITPATNGETKKEVKSDKRKSSLPFAFGKKEKTISDEEGAAEKPKSPSPFSKLRATIKGKGKGTEKASEKSEEVPPVPATEAAAETAPVAEEAPKAAEPEVAAPAAEETAAPKLESTPAVTAAA